MNMTLKPFAVQHRNAGNTLLDAVILAVVTVAVLLPFSGKAFNIDDTLFLWTAEQIHRSPFDVYGFSGNWDGVLRAAPGIIKNPPLASYYLAASAWAVGFGERALHLAFLLPALAVSFGTYALGRRFTSMPLAAALAAVLSPAFMVSANTVMCDVLMLAFYVWAVVLWVRGLDRGEPVTLLIAGLLVAMSALTKYFGMSLIPLLAAYSLIDRKPVRLWLPGLLVPVAALLGYQWFTSVAYGRGLLFEATVYSTSVRGGGGAGIVENTLVGLAFTGGGFIAALFYAPSLWSKRALAAGLIATAAGALVLARLKAIGAAPVSAGGGVRWVLVVEFAVFAAAGASVMVVAVRDALRNRDAASALLALWVLGTFAFMVKFNWTINGRSVLPMVPAAGILVMRSVERRGGASRALHRAFVPLIPCLLVTVAVVWADASLANSARDAARRITGRYARAGGNIWFEGHWGFQYYMEKAGARPVEWGASPIRRGDVLVFPLNNVNLRLVPGADVSVAEDMRLDTSPGWLTTMSLGPGAGFYASEWGPVPYLVGRATPERYIVMFAARDMTLR
ncbi:MAG: ArnT family glycosyltransferase [Thermodesulfobacteriota bacterium]